MTAARARFAAGLVGLPYLPGAEGPAAFDCWGLVRHWYRELHGIDMAPIRVAAEYQVDQAGAIRAAARAGGWRPVPDAEQPIDGDVVLMRNLANGLLHIGVVIDVARADRRLLHCEGSLGRPTPGVLCEPVVAALRRYNDLRVWRRRA